ncbi:MAG: hypothetical protein HRU15_20095, partial [Planctomycetes bacterium]|nr:hypothetical protein [Planctomycetota bacterium]
MPSKTKQSELKQGLVLLVIIVIIAGILWSLPSTMRDQAQDLKCKLRLKRMGDAVNYWIYDNNYRGFPAIKNPKPQSLWQPNRMSSAATILRQYLGGDIPRPRHQDENQDEYVARLRKQDLSVCPVSGYEYWYESLTLGVSDVRTASEEPENHRQEFKYFSCQHHGQQAPHEVDDQAGNFASYGKIIHRLITQEDVDALREQLQLREQENAGKSMKQWSHDLLFLRNRVGSYQQQIAEHPEGFP